MFDIHVFCLRHVVASYQNCLTAAHYFLEKYECHCEKGFFVACANNEGPD